MRILHLIYDHRGNPWIGGGGAIRVYEIYKRLSQKGHQISIVSGRYPDARNLNEDNIEYQFIGMAKNYILSTFSYAYYANKLIRENTDKYDIVLEDFAPWNPIFSYKYGNRIPVALQIQNYMGKEILRKYCLFGIPFFLVEKIYPHKFKKVIIVNDVLRRRYNLPHSVFIGNGIDGGLINERTIDNGTYIGYIGRIDFYQKGLDMLLSQSSGLDIKICGTGKQKDLQELDKYLNEKKYLEYLGYVSGVNKVNFIKNARFLVLPSRFEAQPVAILEAAALQKPLIVSDIPELKFVVDNGFGISFRSKDVRDLEKKITHLWGNDAMVKEMGKRGREFARNYTWDVIAEGFEEFLLECVKK